MTVLHLQLCRRNVAIRALAGLDLGELADDRDALGFGKAGFSKLAVRRL